MKWIRNVYSILLIGFLLGIHNGRIALWIGDDPEPTTVFPYYASMLPKADQKALEKGIAIQDEQRLRSLLEDYLS